MNLFDTNFVEFAVKLGAGMMALGILLAFFRLVRGPSLPDRMLAIDLIALLAMGIMAAYSIARENRALVDVATVLALVAFLGTVAFAYYVERRGCDE